MPDNTPHPKKKKGTPRLGVPSAIMAFDFARLILFGLVFAGLTPIIRLASAMVYQSVALLRAYDDLVAWFFIIIWLMVAFLFTNWIIKFVFWIYPQRVATEKAKRSPSPD